MNYRKGRTWRKRQKGCTSQKLRHYADEKDSSHHVLFQWAKSNGYDTRCSVLIPRTFQDTGRGMACKKRLASGDVIVSVPRRLLITTSTVMEGVIGEIIQRCALKGLSPTNVLCVFLLVEKHKGSASPWESYLSVLPESYTTPSYWTADEVNSLPPWVKEEAVLHIEEVQSSFAACHNLFDELKKEISGLCFALTFEGYRWAWNTVNTRAVYMEQKAHRLLDGSVDNLALAPVLDLLNHSTNAQVKAGFNEENKCYEIQTHDTYRKYDQVFISYGPHDSIKLLVEYGFVLAGNPHNAVPFDLGDLDNNMKGKEISYKAKKLSIICEQQLHKKMCCTSDGISWNLRAATDILMLEPNNFHAWRSCLMGSSISARQETLSKQFLAKLLQQRLTQCPSAECEETDNYHRQMIKQVCREQQEILRHCIGTVT